MKTKFYYLSTLLLLPFFLACNSLDSNNSSLKNALKDKFYIGVALNKYQYTGVDKKAQVVVKKHFNSIVAENCMKSEKLQPREGEFFFDDADKFIAFGEENNMHIIGHTLIWHSQAPRWFFVDENGDDVSPEVLTERMKKHIYTVVGRYKGKVKGWDVVNEAILDNGDWRNSKFYQILGKDFIKLAFQFAHEADPDAELYYNDYSMSVPGRRATVVGLVKSLQDLNLRIDGIGMQGHLNIDSPSVADFEKSILAFSELGVKVMVTELDLSALPNPWVRRISANLTDTASYRERMNPYKDGLPEEVVADWESRYLDFFNLFLKHSDKIDRVTLWGVGDAGSWKNDFPIRGRTDYPLLFDREYNAKPIVSKIVELAKEQS